MNTLVHPSMYGPIFQWVLCVLVLIMAARCNSNAIYNSSVARSMSDIGKVLVLAIILIVGFRPVHWCFGDMVNYAVGYYSRRATGEADALSTLLSFDGEYIFAALQDFCIQYADIYIMFLLYAICFFAGPYIACNRLLGKYWFAPFTASACMIDYWGFAVNGVRNGAAAGLMILALSFKNNRLLAFLLGLLSIGIHKSLLLIAGAAIIAHYYKNTKIYLLGWCASILLSAVAGGAIGNILATYLGAADDRLAQYNSHTHHAIMASQVSRVGFRPDFLLYSAVPIFIGYWYLYVKRVPDTTYQWWFNIYVIANSFWVLMMHSIGSNRIAAISWFIAGIVLMGPFFRYKFTHSQGRYAACALLVWYVFCFYQNILRSSSF